MTDTIAQGITHVGGTGTSCLRRNDVTPAEAGVVCPWGFEWTNPTETAPSKGSQTRSSAFGSPYKFGGATRMIVAQHTREEK
jgi:hypothetical protein